MSMDVALYRESSFGLALPGRLVVDGLECCFTLERVGYAIPAGTYRLLLTVSARAQRHELWTPDQDKFILPLVDGVKGRSGIRFHALNEPTESEGCIGVGLDRVPGRILQSRAALTALMRLLFAVPMKQFIGLTVHNALKETPKKA